VSLARRRLTACGARGLARALAALLALVAMAGCGSSPPAHFFALAPSPEHPAVAGEASTAPAAPHAIRLRRPSIPGYLDRPEIVRSVVGYRLGLGNSERWGGPLDEMIGRVLAQDIERRLPGSSVFTEDGAITADPDATVEINVQRFEVSDGGDVSLAVEVAVTRGPDRVAATTRAVHLGARPEDGTTSGLVATMSALLGQLADQIATMLRG
jgi:uncharacterized lipoprotein YmbA